MNKLIIPLLKLIETPQSIKTIANRLSLDLHKSLELIGHINAISPQIISNNANAEYVLTIPANWLDEELIRAKLVNEHQIFLYPELPSSNDHILNNINQFKHGSIVSCEFQSRGRGRQANRWQSKIGHDITVSILYTFELDFDIGQMPLISGIAVNRLFKDYSIVTKIKWPNDIFYNNEKIAGILVESSIFNNQRHVVIGIGINNFANLERNQMIAKLINHLDNVISEFALCGFNLLRQEWLDNCIHYKKAIYLYQDGELISAGIHTDLSNIGELIIVDKKKKIRSFISSAISLRFDEQLHNLLIDAGNSHVKIALYKHRELIKLYILDTHNLDFTQFIDDTQGMIFKQKLGSSVVDLNTKNMIDNAIDNIQWISPRAQCMGFRVHPNIDPATLGTDLWLMGIAAFNNTKASTLVISCGTAFAALYISKIGQFMGGKIVPGLYKQLEILSNSTAQIDYIQSGQYISMPQKTEDAVISGILDGFLGVIQLSLADLASIDGGNATPKLVINGGYANYLQNALSGVEHLHFDNLVLEGLGYFLEE